jgi:hypothetical protein
MIERLFPARFDNVYRGHPLALWLLFPLTFVNTGIGLASIFRPDSGAQSADGIPLNHFGGGGAQAVIGTVALLGLARVLMGLLAGLALARYRAMIPLIYLLTVTDVLAHRAILVMKPIASGPSAGGYVVVTLTLLSIVGLALSLIGRGYAADRTR